MSKVITLRLSEEEYQKISLAADIEHRPISNFITATLIKDIEESYFADSIETAQIMSDKRLLEKLRAGHKDAKAGGDIAGNARKELEKRIRRPIVSRRNFLKQSERTKKLAEKK